MTEEDNQKFINSNFKNHPFNNKVVTHILAVQPTYSYLLKYASQLNDSTTVCICNTDIEILIHDENIPSLFDYLRDKKMCYFITRHEYDMTDFLIKNFGGSHDAFVFNTEVLKESLKDKDLNYINYIQNTSGIEALLTLFFIDSLQYEILNPCWQMILKHHHKSNVRLWAAASPGPIGYTYPHKLNHASRIIHCSYMIKPCKISF